MRDLEREIEEPSEDGEEKKSRRRMLCFGYGTCISSNLYLIMEERQLAKDQDARQNRKNVGVWRFGTERERLERRNWERLKQVRTKEVRAREVRTTEVRTTRTTEVRKKVTERSWNERRTRKQESKCSPVLCPSRLCPLLPLSCPSRHHQSLARRMKSGKPLAGRK